MRDFRGKTAIITGASSGIGRALALVAAREGMNVVVSAPNRDTLEPVAAEVRQMGVRSTAIVCDVSKRQDVKSLAEQSFAEFATIDLK